MRMMRMMQLARLAGADACRHRLRPSRGVPWGRRGFLASLSWCIGTFEWEARPEIRGPKSASGACEAPRRSCCARRHRWAKGHEASYALFLSLDRMVPDDREVYNEIPWNGVLAVQRVFLLASHARTQLHQVNVQRVVESWEVASRSQQVFHQRATARTQFHQLHLLWLSQTLPLRHTPDSDQFTESLVYLGRSDEMALLFSDYIAIMIKA